MKYVITGGAGNTSKPLAKKLLNAGHSVTVLSRMENNLKELRQAGAKTAIGSLEDAEFLKKSFAGADAVYTMCPPNIMTNDMRGYHVQLGKNYAEAIQFNGIRHVVNLSAIGAHIDNGAGPVSAIHLLEEELNRLQNVNIKHLRAGYFYNNLFFYIGMIKNGGIIGNNFAKTAKQLPMVDTSDIAAVAAEELMSLNFSGHSYRYIVSDETDTDEIATLIGKAIGRPELKWLTFTNEQAFDGLRQAGFTEEIAINYRDLGNAIHSGRLFEDYQKQRPAQLGSVKLQDFMAVFTSAYNNN